MSKILPPSSFEMEMRAASHRIFLRVYNLHFNVFRILFFATSAKYGAYIILRYADLSREDCRQHTEGAFQLFFFALPNLEEDAFAHPPGGSVSFGNVNYDSLVLTIGYYFEKVV